MGFPDPAVSTGFVHQLLSALPNIVDAACGCASFLRERVRDGDRIRLSVESKQIDLLVDDTEIRRRLEDFRRPPTPARGYKALYRRTVTQAPEGCDFDFLTGVSPDA